MRTVKREELEKLPGYEHLIPEDTLAIISEVNGAPHLLGSHWTGPGALEESGSYLDIRRRDSRDSEDPILTNLELVNIG